MSGHGPRTSPPLRALALGGALAVGVAAALVGCGGDVVVRVEAPLSVVGTYPASGALTDRDAARELRLLFSQPLGAAGADGDLLRDHVLLDSALDSDAPWRPLPIADFQPQDSDASLLLRPQGAALDVLPAGAELRLTVRSGLTAGGGARLARDQLFFFQLSD